VQTQIMQKIKFEESREKKRKIFILVHSSSRVTSSFLCKLAKKFTNI